MENIDELMGQLKRDEDYAQEEYLRHPDMVTEALLKGCKEKISKLSEIKELVEKKP